MTGEELVRTVVEGGRGDRSDQVFATRISRITVFIFRNTFLRYGQSTMVRINVRRGDYSPASTAIRTASAEVGTPSF